MKGESLIKPTWAALFEVECGFIYLEVWGIQNM